jgi:hypothetical protein
MADAPEAGQEYTKSHLVHASSASFVPSLGAFFYLRAVERLVGAALAAMLLTLKSLAAVAPTDELR